MKIVRLDDPSNQLFSAICVIQINLWLTRRDGIAGANEYMRHSHIHLFSIHWLVRNWIRPCAGGKKWICFWKRGSELVSSHFTSVFSYFTSAPATNLHWFYAWNLINLFHSSWIGLWVRVCVFGRGWWGVWPLWICKGVMCVCIRIHVASGWALLTQQLQSNSWDLLVCEIIPHFLHKWLTIVLLAL